MISPFILGLAVLPCLGAAYLEDPPTTAAPDTIADCSAWHVAAENETCASISKSWYITEAQFVVWVSLELGLQRYQF